MSAVVYISIGNSDDKLSQAEWAEFVRRVEYVVNVAADARGGHIHGSWRSASDTPWQNACWALQLPEDLQVTRNLSRNLAYLAGEFKQDSIAWALAPETTFIAAVPA
ncbi:hypothetical protein [Micromonospora sp. NPDC047730]|uniref:hypothetical protein n=1 Tax=Micromonospora sp. NPDC047730 TaxID=3364253 RepID=UPI00371D13EA